MSAPLRAQDPDEPSRRSVSPPLAQVTGADSPRLQVLARNAAESAVADVMALEDRKAKRLLETHARQSRKPLDRSGLALIVLLLGLVYLVDVQPKWMIAPIPANGAMFQYYRESWRDAIDQRQQQVLDKRLRKQSPGLPRLPLTLPHVTVHRAPSAYFRRGDSFRVVVVKSVALDTRMILLGGR